MIYYSILYPPLLPISIPAFEWEEGEARWRLYFDTSIGNKIDDFKGGFIRIRSSESEVSSLDKDGENPYYYDLVPFRNPFAEYHDPYDESRSELQPEGYPEGMPSVKRDKENNYYVDVPHRVFSPERGHLDKRFKVQIMLTKDWIRSEEEDGSGDIEAYDIETESYRLLDKDTYFGGSLVEKGLSEWSRVTLVSPVSEAKYELIFDKWGDTEKGYLNSPIVEFVGARILDEKPKSFDGNYLKAYRISIYDVIEGERGPLFETSDWIVGQENPNLEIRWQNELEFEDKTDYIVELEIQTLWELRKIFQYRAYTNFEVSLFQGKVKAVNDHDKARVKIIMSARSPLTWGPADLFEIERGSGGFAKIHSDQQNGVSASIEQGIDLTPQNGSFAGEMIIKDIEPIPSWEEDDSKFFFRLTGPPLSVHNRFQEEYLIYAHSAPISEVPETPIYEEDILINPVMRSASGGESFETYMDTSGVIATQPTEAPASHTYFFLLDDEQKVWRVTLADDGAFVTKRAVEYDGQLDEEMRPVYLYDRHFKNIASLLVGVDGKLRLGRAFPFELGKQTKPMYINEFRLVKRLWGLELGRKRLIGKQTYRAFMNDFNRKLGKWNIIEPYREYYVYFASMKGQLFLYVKDLTASSFASQNAVDRYNLAHAGLGMDLPNASIFVSTTGVDEEFLPVKDGTFGRHIDYVLSVDERGTLVSEIGFIGSSTTAQVRTKKWEEKEDEE